MKRSIPLAFLSAAILAACASDGDDAYNGTTDADRTTGRTPDRPISETERARRGDYQQMSAADARILSILHAKNLEEIEIGRLAQERGVSDDVRRFGEMLVRDHGENDSMVQSTANAANITLLQPRDVHESLAREKGLDTPPRDPIEELRGLTGESFDRTFAQKMLEGHRELIQIVENARPNVQDSSVRDLLDRTLPALRKHEAEARQLANR